jgi:diguanylate cyclase (GGDEF)-like protein
LKELADLMCRQLRKTDVVWRLGGEEFGILLPNTTLDQAARLADRLCQAIKNSDVSAMEHRFRTSISVGAATCAPSIKGVDELVKYADIALYRAKSAGGNCVRTYTPAIPCPADKNPEN